MSPNTPFYCFSVVKGAAATLAHVLAERRLFGYDTPIVDAWPEFGAHGKHAVTVRQVLNHSAGVPGAFAGSASRTWTGGVEPAAAGVALS